jgi:dihydroorotate dehydrogenase (fumarate)
MHAIKICMRIMNPHRRRRNYGFHHDTFRTLNLKNPLIASASPLTSSVESIQRLEDNGIAAVIMHSLFEEEINHEIHQIDHFLHINSDFNAEATSYLPSEVDFENLQADNYLEEIRRIKESVSTPDYRQS